MNKLDKTQASKEQENTLESFLDSTTHPVPESYFENKPYKEILAEELIQDYEKLEER